MADSNGIDWTNPAVQKVFGIDDETSKRMHTMYDEVGIEWHVRSDGRDCMNRHGVVRNVKNSDWQSVQRMLEWFYGKNCCRWQKEPGGTFAVEFVHMAKVFPPPNRPWGWCGETMLFGAWQARDEQTSEAVRSFDPGMPVTFEHSGVTKRGLVMYANEKTVSVIVEGEGRWRVSPSRLTKL